MLVSPIWICHIVDVVEGLIEDRIKAVTPRNAKFDVLKVASRFEVDACVSVGEESFGGNDVTFLINSKVTNQGVFWYGKVLTH